MIIGIERIQLYQHPVLYFAIITMSPLQKGCLEDPSPAWGLATL